MSDPTPAPLTDEQIDQDALMAVPTGTVVRATDGTIACRYDETRGVVFGDERPFPWSVLNAPAEVLWPRDLAAVIARAKREAAEEIASSGVMHIWGFLSGRDDLVSDVSVALCPGELSEVANHLINDAREHGYDVKSWTVRSLDGFLREVHAVWAAVPDMPMWHRLITPSTPWVKEADHA